MYQVPLINYPAISPLKLALELPYAITYSGEYATVYSADETAILTAFAAHVPDEVPYFLYRVIEATDSHLISHVGAASIESTGNFKRIYFDPIPDTLTVDTLLGTFVEPDGYETVNLIKYSGKTVYETNADVFAALQPEEIVVSKNSARFSTIEAAILYINTLDNKKVLIKLFPGIYYENNPLTIPDYVSIRGQGSGGNTTVIGLNAAAVFITGEFCSIRDISIAGGTVGIEHIGTNSNSFALIKDSIIVMNNDGLGVSCTGGLGSLILSHMSITAGIGTGTAMWVVGGSLIASEVIIQATVLRGIYVRAGNCTLNTVSVYNCSTAMEALNSSTVKSTLLNIIGCTRGLYFPVNTVSGQYTTFGAAYLSIMDATTDVEVLEPTVINLFGSVVDLDKVINDTGSEIGGVMIKNDGNHRDVILSGDFSVNGRLDFAVRKCILNFWTNYAGCTDPINSFYTETTVGTVEYWNGGWIAANFMKIGFYYWLDMNHVQTETTVNGIVGFWLKFDVAVTEMEAHEDSTAFSNEKRYYIGKARKKNRIYLQPTVGTANFYLPEDADTSTAYNILVSATTSGITVDGNFITGTTVTAQKRFTVANIQSFTVAGIGITIICVEYYMYKF